MTSPDDLLKDRVATLARSYLKRIEKTMKSHPELGSFDGEFYFAGGAFKSLDFQTGCDFDLFPLLGTEWVNVEKAQWRSKNATTLVKGDTMVQLCNFSRPSLLSLLESFDFSPCKAGVKIKNWEVVEVGWCSEWEKWILGREITYTPGSYPLSSLLRIPKMFKAGLISSLDQKKLTLEVLYHLAKRGFSSSEDLRDQLDAIDLNLSGEVGGEHYRLLEVLPGVS